MPALHCRTTLIPTLGLLTLLSAGPALAGSATAGSIISKQDAIDNAANAMPIGNEITGVRCTTMIRALSARYRCTVQWSPETNESGS
jgi:hypothetical protein